MVLKYIDILGPEMKLNIENNSQLKSRIGGISTIILVFIFLSICLGLSLDFIYKKKPKITINKIKNDYKPVYNMSSDNFIFTIYDQETNNAISDIQNRFDIVYEIITFVNNTAIIGKKIEFEVCNDTVRQNWNSFFTKNLSYFCFPTIKNISISDKFNNPNKTLIRVQVEYCNQTARNERNNTINCISKNVTKNDLLKKRLQMHLLIKDTIINTNNYSYPFSESMFSTIINSNIDSWTRMVVRYKRIKIKSDYGFIYEFNHNECKFGIDFTTLESVYSNDTDTLFSHILMNSDSLEIYERDYVKLYDVLGQANGIISFLLVGFSYAIEYYSKPHLFNVFNNNYCYLDTKHFKDKINHTSFNSINLKTNNKYNNLYNIKKNFKSMYYVKHDFVNIIPCTRNKLNKILQVKIEDKMNKIFSFENFIKISKYTKIMKSLIFEEYQRNMFKFSPSPIKKNNYSREFIIENFIKEAKNNHIDEKIYNLFDGN